MLNTCLFIVCLTPCPSLETLFQVQALRSKYPNLNIQVDGGLDVHTIDTAAKAGANVIVSGTGIFKANDPKEAMAVMRNAVQAYL